MDWKLFIIAFFLNSFLVFCVWTLLKKQNQKAIRKIQDELKELRQFAFKTFDVKIIAPPDSDITKMHRKTRYRNEEQTEEVELECTLIIKVLRTLLKTPKKTARAINKENKEQQ
ncbi:hypothetical protein [Helicobacter sp. 11S02596-1]|uniref:hypothetical protein n=1 Tax=Helicobacter sp. 11S02596-1 TaxID=1476194 RepID=UPI000BA5DE20|nr:hypothetical protein [Helicobacter sp. 11S02596-1]PAF41384.1 hypothetical protein BJI48_08820 [Helicobacter sp. 11S02596-1]